MSRTVPHWVALLGLTLCGCAENGFLELSIRLPSAPSSDAPWYGQIEINNDVWYPLSTFETWSGVRALDSRELGEEPQWDCISVEAQTSVQRVNVRVQFCREPNCTDLTTANPSRLLTMEHPVYVGRRTFLTIDDLSPVPVCSEDSDCERADDHRLGRCYGVVCGCRIDADCCDEGETCPRVCVVGDGDTQGQCLDSYERCQIPGCIAGHTTNHYCNSDGLHFCEYQPTVDMRSECE